MSIFRNGEEFQSSVPSNVFELVQDVSHAPWELSIHAQQELTAPSVDLVICAVYQIMSLF